MRKTQKQSGMTLVELSLAGVLVSVALIGTTASLFSSVSLHETISRKRGATRSVSSLLEDVRATDFADLATTYTDTNHVVKDGGGRNGTARVTITDVPGTPSEWRVHEVRINVTYPNSDLDDALTFATYVSNRTEGGGRSAPAPTAADVPSEGGSLLDLITSAEAALSTQTAETADAVEAELEGILLVSSSSFAFAPSESLSLESSTPLVADTVEPTSPETVTYDALVALYMEMLGGYY